VVGGFVATLFATYWATNDTFFVKLGWSRGFWAPALMLTIIAVIYAVYTRNRPRDAGFSDLPEDDTVDATENQETKKTVLRQVLRERALWVIGIMYFFTKLTRYAFLFWLPLYMTEALSYTDSVAGYTSSVYELVGFFGVLIAGYASDKLFQARRFPVGALMLYGLTLALFFHPTLSEFGPIANAISIGVIGIMTLGPDTLMSGAGAMDIGSQRGAATAAGLIKITHEYVTASQSVETPNLCSYLAFLCRILSVSEEFQCSHAIADRRIRV